MQAIPFNYRRRRLSARMRVFQFLAAGITLVAVQIALAAQPGAIDLSALTAEARAESLHRDVAEVAAKDPRPTDETTNVLIPVTPPLSPPRVWSGISAQNVNLRGSPDRSSPPVGELKAGQPVQVSRWVSGEEIERANTTWAELTTGQFVFSTALRRAPIVTAPALPADVPAAGRWIDVNLFEQVATAYDGRTPAKTVLISSGRPGWDTPVGSFTVLRRVENETMDGSTLAGQGPDGRGASYLVENVRFTQYFTPDGAAIHENYWRDPATFGMPGSHGCIGMTPADAAWFWDFASVGTPLVVHS